MNGNWRGVYRWHHLQETAVDTVIAQAKLLAEDLIANV
jgi:hypothetical protein